MPKSETETRKQDKACILDFNYQSVCKMKKNLSQGFLKLAGFVPPNCVIFLILSKMSNHGVLSDNNIYHGSK